jgi:hypothetical protein
MNEQIKNLALQAGFKNYEGTSIYSPYIEGMELNDELKEFAELIIKDCLEIMNEQMYNTSVLLTYPGKSSAIWDAKNAISLKYGIK